LTSQNIVLTESSQEKIMFNNREMPKLSSNQLMIHVLKKDGRIQDAYDALNQTEDSAHTTKNRIPRSIQGKKLFRYP
jgi:hypothetical protein